MLLLFDVSKREVSTQPQLNVLPHAYLMLMCWYVVVVWAGLNGGLFSETMDFRDFPSVLSAVRVAQS